MQVRHYAHAALTSSVQQMALAAFDIHDFRILSKARLEPCAGVNLITGQNASGKTSILEAIYYLGQLRSFRTSRVSELIQHHQERFLLNADIETRHGNVIPVGIERGLKKSKIHVRQQVVHQAVDLVALSPVLALHPESHRLISDGPGYRRRFMDWGVFHVEHGYLTLWKRYRRVLSQRNAAIRQNQSNNAISLWNHELVDCAVEIDQQRAASIDHLQAETGRICVQYFPEHEITLNYKRGWVEGVDLRDLLISGLEGDRRLGYTRYGPHRADIEIRVNTLSASTAISRGQQKLTVALLYLAQAWLYQKNSGEPCCLLYDDLAAELDHENRVKLLILIENLNAQVFVTAISSDLMDLSAWTQKKVFHVKHGDLKELL